MVIKGHGNPLNYKHSAVFGGCARTEVDWGCTGEFHKVWCHL